MRNKYVDEGKLGELRNKYVDEGKLGELRNKYVDEGKLSDMRNKYVDEDKLGELRNKYVDEGKLNDMRNKYVDEGKLGELRNKYVDEGKLGELRNKYVDEGKLGDMRNKYVDEGKLGDMRNKYVDEGKLGELRNKYNINDDNNGDNDNNFDESLFIDECNKHSDCGNNEYCNIWKSCSSCSYNPENTDNPVNECKMSDDSIDKDCNKCEIKPRAYVKHPKGYNFSSTQKAEKACNKAGYHLCSPGELELFVKDNTKKLRGYKWCIKDKCKTRHVNPKNICYSGYLSSDIPNSDVNVGWFQGSKVKGCGKKNQWNKLRPTEPIGAHCCANNKEFKNIKCNIKSNNDCKKSNNCILDKENNKCIGKPNWVNTYDCIINECSLNIDENDENDINKCINKKCNTSKSLLKELNVCKKKDKIMDCMSRGGINLCFIEGKNDPQKDTICRIPTKNITNKCDVKSIDDISNNSNVVPIINSDNSFLIKKKNNKFCKGTHPEINISTMGDDDGDREGIDGDREGIDGDREDDSRENDSRGDGDRGDGDRGDGDRGDDTKSNYNKESTNVFDCYVQNCKTSDNINKCLDENKCYREKECTNDKCNSPITNLNQLQNCKYDDNLIYGFSVNINSKQEDNYSVFYVDGGSDNKFACKIPQSKIKNSCNDNIVNKIKTIDNIDTLIYNDVYLQKYKNDDNNERYCKISPEKLMNNLKYDECSTIKESKCTLHMRNNVIMCTDNNNNNNKCKINNTKYSECSENYDKTDCQTLYGPNGFSKEICNNNGTFCYKTKTNSNLDVNEDNTNNTDNTKENTNNIPKCKSLSEFTPDTICTPENKSHNLICTLNNNSSNKCLLEVTSNKSSNQPPDPPPKCNTINKDIKQVCINIDIPGISVKIPLCVYQTDNKKENPIKTCRKVM